MGPFLETLFGGLMTGMLYSLIALGFVLIYKASGVFNFAQGAMVLSAALARTPLGRLGEPVDIAGPVLLLCSPAAAWITGQTLAVDGGFTVAM